MTVVAPVAPVALALRSENGEALADSSARWTGMPLPEDERVLDRARGPVLDVGCGPGRHVLALARRGIPAMGVDITPAAVGMARASGAMVLRRSVFDRLPGHGRWQTALLLDGNVGIGGDPSLLLTRLHSLLSPGGQILVEIATGATDSCRRPTGAGDEPMLARLEHGSATGPWFGWAHVSIDDLGVASQGSGFLADETWTDNGRLFASLTRP